MSDARRGTLTVLLVSDNGHGLGHVTRLMAIARRLPEGARPVLLTLSEAHPVVRDQGLAVEYFPSRLRLRLQKSRWSPLFALRLQDAIERFRPAVVVIDHVAPAAAVAVARDANPDVTFVWSRRGLWKAGSNASARESRAWFDHVLEPGDVAAWLDEGFTALDDGPVTRVDPITLLGRDELLSRADARAALGLPTERPCALVALSADDPDALVRMIRRVREVTDRVAPGVHLFAPRHALHGDRLADVPGVTLRPVYPVARYLHAFDLAIAAAGYNTVHEVLRAGVPAILVPKVTDSVDDQQTRARGAASRGLAWAVDDLQDGTFEEAVRAALTSAPDVPDAPDVVTNGAEAAAEFLADLAVRPPTPREPSDVPAPDRDTLEGAWARFMSGWSRADRAVPVRALDVVDLSDADLRVLARDLVAEQERGAASTKTVLLVAASSDVAVLSTTSIAYETCLTPEQVVHLVPDRSYEEYREQRLTSVAAVFGATEQRRLGSTADGDETRGRWRPRVTTRRLVRRRRRR